ncbi:MAG TPA: YceI family protein [Albitalea sp.]|uniref:YceI family protein n=1 Tax=Piscinibacter sp. TaxID=1903157 RepID=UPI002ED49055
MTQTSLILATLCAAAGVAGAQGVTYQVDPSHTFVTFEANHFNTSTLRGRFDRKDGTVVIDRQARTGRAEITFDTASVSTGVGPLDKHLRGKDFLDVERWPEARFTSERFTFEGDKVSAVAGNLTLLGKTLPVTLKATHFNCYQNVLLKREVCGGDFETAILRSQWGMTYGFDYGLPDRIRLLIQIEAVRQ